MKTYFIQNDSKIFRDFLDSKGIKYVDSEINLTGVICRDEQTLFFIGLQYGEFLTINK